MKNGKYLESNCIKKSGAGLPYAPMNWPNPGDIWTWKLGKRISSNGYYRDKYIFLPPRLQKKLGRNPYFSSKKAIINYLQAEFPEADIAAFFDSFTWKVPAYVGSSAEKAQVTPRPKKVRRKNKSDKKEVTKSTKRRSQRIMSATRRAKYSLSDSDDVIIIDLSESTAANSKSANDRNSDSCHSSEEHRSEMVSDDGKMLFDFEDNSPSEYLPDSSDSASVSHQSTAPRKEMAEARKKLSLLLATDNPVLLSSNKLSEILRLTSLLKSDSTLDANQHDILKLIDKIPLACKELQENEKIAEEADRFNEDLETNIAWATTLENEYNDSKGYAALLQTELDSSSRKVKKLQDQIAVLTKAAEMKKKEVDRLISKQQMVDECLPKVLKEIVTGKDQKAKWELKKQRAEEQKAKILSKFAPLKGLSL